MLKENIFPLEIQGNCCETTKTPTSSLNKVNGKLSCEIQRPLSTGSIQSNSQIIIEVKQGQFELENGLSAKVAFSCVVAPEKGDKVLYVQGQEEGSYSAEVYILAVLERKSVEDESNPNQKTANLTVPGVDNLRIVQPNIQCYASQKIKLGSKESITLTSLTGNVELKAQNLIYSAVGSILESAKERISNAGFIQFCSSFLTRIHSNQTIITADTDIKLDAERVNLG